MGLRKNNKSVFSLLLVLVFFIGVFSMVSVSAAHEAIVTLDPSIANCNNIGSTFTVNVENDLGSDDEILQVEIYKALEGISEEDFVCGNAPTGWTLFSYEDRCIYVTGLTNPAKISPGENLDFTFEATIIPAESCGSLFTIVTVDDARPVGDRNTYDKNVYIDCSDPVIEKVVGDPKIEGQGFDWWITQSTPIEITSYDNEDQCDLGIDYCRWRFTLDNGSPREWNIINDPVEGELIWPLEFDEDSEHYIEVECYDLAGNMETLEETDKIDTTPPETVKTFSPEGSYKIDGDLEWTDSITQITLTPTDGGLICAIGVADTFYKLLGPVEDRYCWNACDGWQTSDATLNGDGWTPYTAPLGNINESCHVLEYYSTDEIGNIEQVNVNCFFVDKTPPEITKEIGRPSVPCAEFGDDSCDYYMNTSTPITLNCEDVGPHPSGDVTISYRYRYDEGQGFSDWTDVVSEQSSSVTFVYPEPSIHELEYWCTDAVGKVSDHLFETDKVDNEAPILTKVVGEPKYTCGEIDPTYDGDGDCYYIRDNTVLPGTPITLSVVDTPANHATDHAYCSWWYEYMGDVYKGGTFDEGDTEVVTFDEDSTHILHVECWDAVGNHYEDVEEFRVDSIPPVTTKTYGEPSWPESINVPGAYPHFINSSTPITLEAEDEKVGVDKIFWRYQVVADKWCRTEYSGCQNYEGELGDFAEYLSPVTLPEESCHLIEFYSTDLLGNTESVKRQCVFVDNTGPNATKEIGEPHIAKDEKDYITQETPITITCTDAQPHPIGDYADNSLWYRYRTSNDCENWGEFTNWTDPQDGTKTFSFPEDSCHELEYYCVDALGNRGYVYHEIDVVDSVAPHISTTFNAPLYDNGTAIFIDAASSITVDAFDPQPHPVDDVLCTWSYTVNGKLTGSSDGSVTAPFTLQFPEESHHVLTVTCWDELGNTNATSVDFYADHTAPLIWKDESVFLNYSFGNYWAQWINNLTEIHANVTDVGAHLSGIKEVKYRTTLVDDEDCKYYYPQEVFDSYVPSSDYDCDEALENGGSWTTVSPEAYADFSFTIPDESCHLIEIMATDNVDKCALHKQWAYVDTSAPETNKTVGEPKEPWNGLDANFYDLADFCSIEGNCWKVTTMTPITLDCSDVEPHPVNHEEIFFKVELDGDDYTEVYCNKLAQDYEVEYNVSGDGYCHIDGTEAPINFFFTEESEHNLKYYCVDALGNAGPVDDEKFKVDGDAFRIILNKKWNLISVPVKLLDDSMDAVFEDASDAVDSVWQFDGENWHVYTPDGDSSNDDITTMEPGWGYWILAQNDTEIVIGGSLISPAMTPPSRDIVAGWNLIGYYGTDGAPEVDGVPSYIGPEGNGKMAGCALYSLGSSVLDKGWTSLISYWEPYNPQQWSYEWEPSQYDYYHNLDAGAGYWLLAQDDGIYAPTTVSCGMLL